MDTALREALGGILGQIRDSDDPKELATVLMGLEALRRELGDLIAENHEKLAQTLKKKQTDLGPGIGVVERTRDSKTTWNHEDLYQDVIKRHRKTDPETGEVTVDGVELANELRVLLAFAYWRKTALRDRKIDPDEYSTTIYGRPRIRFLSKEGK